MGVPISNLSSFLDGKIVDVLRRRGFVELYDWQYNAILKGLDGTNMVVVAPTGAGKSLPAEILAVDYVLKTKKKVVYVAPLRSLTREKFNDFRKWYSAGIKTGLAMGEYWVESGSLVDKDIIVTTYAKLISLINHNSSFLKDVGMVIIDEFHIMGPEVEVIVAFSKLKGWRVLALSATVGNLEELAEWMDARIYRSANRPIKLQGGVVVNGTIHWVSGQKEYKGSSWIDVVKDFVDKGLSVIVFVYSRRNAESIAKKVSVAFDIDESIEVPKELYNFQNLVQRGIMFHHAGLKNKERNTVEEMFRNGILKVIVATRTLAMGVNLPADVVIIKDIVRPKPDGSGVDWVDVMDVWQMLGRAGRRGKSKVGIGLIYTSKVKNKKYIIERYFEGKIEDATSKFINYLDNAIVTFLAYNKGASLEEILDFIDSTYGGYLNENLMFLGYESISRLISNNMVVCEDKYKLTKLGKLVARLFISVDSAKKMVKFSSTNVLDVLWFLSGLREFDVPRVAKKDYPKIEFILDMFASSSKDRKNEMFWGRAKVMAVVLAWINGDEIDDIVKKFNIGFGDIRVILETMEWLSYSLKKIKEFFGDENIELYDDLVWMIKYGVTRELVSFVKIKGVGRKRAMQLAATAKFKKDAEEYSKLSKNSLTYWVGG